MTTTVFNIVRQEQLAGEILNNLHDNGFVNREISLLCLAKIQDTALSRGENFLQGSLDWLAAAETLPFSRDGLFLVTGQFLAAVKRVEDSDRQLSTLLSNFGLSAGEAQLYAAKLKRGNVLLTVHADSPASSLRATTVFESAAQYGCTLLNQGNY